MIETLTIVHGEHAAEIVAAKLVKDSTFFTVTPRPYDEWHFGVRQGEADRTRERIGLA